MNQDPLDYFRKAGWWPRLNESDRERATWTSAQCKLALDALIEIVGREKKHIKQLQKEVERLEEMLASEDALR